MDWVPGIIFCSLLLAIIILSIYFCCTPDKKEKEEALFQKKLQTAIYEKLSMDNEVMNLIKTLLSESKEDEKAEKK